MSNIKINNSLSVDRSIFDFLSNTSDIICNLILNIRTLEGINYISPSDKEDVITCLPQSKYINSISFDPYSDGVGRMTMRVGRIVTKLIPEDYISHHKINDKFSTGANITIAGGKGTGKSFSYLIYSHLTEPLLNLRLKEANGKGKISE